MNQDRPLLRRVGLALLTACVPLIVTWLLLVVQGYQWDDYAPVMGDEIMYWHQAATWARVGLDSGYYSIDSLPARAAHYFCWGLGPVLFYGIFATVFGWSLNSILYINAIFLFSGIVIFVLLARLDARRCAWLAVMLAVYPAILVYLPTSMIEPIHLGGALVVAGGLYRLHIGQADWIVVLITGGTLLLLSFLKITWVPMFWPFFYFLPTWRVWTLRRIETPPMSSPASETVISVRQNVWLAMILTGVVGFLINIFYSLTAAPYPYDLGLALKDLKTDLIIGVYSYAGLLFLNILGLLSPFYPLSNGIRIAMIGLVAWALIQRRKILNWITREAVTLVLFVNVSVLLLALFVYVTQDHRGFRLLSPYVLLTFGLVLAWNRISVVRALVALFVVTLPMVLPSLQDKGDYFNPERAGRIAAYQEDFREAGIVYQEGRAPWCNAFAHNISYLSEFADQDRLLAVEPGLGMTIMWYEPYKATPARYVMLDDLSYQLYPDTTLLTPLIPVEYGMIYLNEAANCA